MTVCVGERVPPSVAGVLMVALLSGTALAQPNDPEDGAATIRIGESRLELYGFVRVDAIYDDSRTDAAQTPTFVLSEDPRTGLVNQSTFTLHPRLTRVGARVTSPPDVTVVGGAMSGRVEIDFQAGGRESRQLIRLRHGYFQIAWAGVSLLAGQTSDIISPLFPSVNQDTLMWNAGNLGDRRPQFRVTWSSPTGTEPAPRPSWSFVVGLGLPGAIHPQDLDGDGVRDGEASGVPNVQTRLGVSVPIAETGRALRVGVSAHVGQEAVSVPIGGADRFQTWSVSLDHELDLASRVVLRGELWTGQNLSDFRAGSGQGVNADLGTGIRATGGWIEARVDLSSLYDLSVGYSVDDPADRDLPDGGRAKNGAWYLVNQFQLNRLLLVGADYLRWTTSYSGLPDGVDNRVNAYGILRF